MRVFIVLETESNEVLGVFRQRKRAVARIGELSQLHRHDVMRCVREGCTLPRKYYTLIERGIT